VDEKLGRESIQASWFSIELHAASTSAPISASPSTLVTPRISPKAWARSHLDRDSLLYGVVARAYGWLSLSRFRLKGDSIFRHPDELKWCSLLPETVLDVVIDQLKPASLLDVCCGTGRAVSYLVDRGIDAVGVEGSPLALEHVRDQDRARFHLADLRRPLDLGRQFSVVWTYEVAEHIHPAYADVFVASLVRHADWVVMSAAPPGQGGIGHFNEQPPKYWISKMALVSYELDETLSQRLQATPDEHAANMLAFRH
jgi:SAM-dependent methyltransferase